MEINRTKKTHSNESLFLLSNKELIIELNNYLSFYILKERIKMKEFFKSIRKHILSGKPLSPSQFETLIPYLENEPEMRHLGRNRPELTRQKVIERYIPIVRNSQITKQHSTLEQFF